MKPPGLALLLLGLLAVLGASGDSQGQPDAPPTPTLHGGLATDQPAVDADSTLPSSALAANNSSSLSSRPGDAEGSLEMSTINGDDAVAGQCDVAVAPTTCAVQSLAAAAQQVDGTAAAGPSSGASDSTAARAGADSGLSSQAATPAAPSGASSTSPCSSGSAPSAPSSLAIASTLSIIHWSELKLVGSTAGSGSFGKVVLAMLEETPVAAKVLVPLKAGVSSQSAAAAGMLSERDLAKFRRESSLLASVRHPNIVQILGACENPPAIIMEYCDRGSLRDVLHNALGSPVLAAQLTWRRRLAMAMDAARGLLHLHNRGIAHRDLKSPNLVVDSGWRVKLADFGSSKALDGDDVLSMAALEEFNPRWQAPEVLLGEPATIASDTHAFGTILWELLTWEVPWSGDILSRIIALKANGAQLEVPASPGGFARLPGTAQERAAFQPVAAQYIQLIKQCWATKAADRPGFRTIVQQLREIQRALSDLSG